MKSLEEIKNEKQSTKSVIFSQWTSMLDLIEIPLTQNNYQFLRLDGTVPQAQRESILEKFTNKDECTILLVSLRAGGVGLNLTAATNCFLMDIWWNPAGNFSFFLSSYYHYFISL